MKRVSYQEKPEYPISCVGKLNKVSLGPVLLLNTF